MDNEKEFIYEIEPDVSELNEYGYLKPYAYQNLFGKIAESHLNKINLNVDTTMKYGLAWVLISISLEIVQPVKGCIKLFAQTWHSQRKGPFFRRELVFKDEKGNILFHGSTFSVLMDLETRTVFRKKEAPFFIGPPTQEFTIDARPTFKTNAIFTEIDKRKVYNSYIDCLGHVNNMRYGEFAYDALNDEEKENLHKMKRYEVFFLSELRNKDIFSVQRARINNNVIIRGVNETTGETSFDVLMGFDI
ncbi:MAG: hypothetical protein GX386_10460 [Clostridiaceae bacterium]|jgi:medium-chain acyl-[acyl-carrier-protein] hydrolase|nr:hypothetical protein [Clostridiaceae bacterium]